MTELGAVRRRDAGQAVCDAIRNDVVTRVFTPGDRLTEERLAARYRVSRIPVREALRTLEAEGFVHSRPYGGTFVAELSDKEAEDLLGIRLLIEPFGAERAATRRTAVHLATLELLVAEAREILDRRLVDRARRSQHPLPPGTGRGVGQSDAGGTGGTARVQDLLGVFSRTPAARTGLVGRARGDRPGAARPEPEGGT